MMNTIHFKIMFPPITKKNSQQILINKKTGRPFIMPSRNYKAYEKSAGWYLRPLGIDYPVNIKAHFYMPTRRKVDLTNLLSALDDVLVHHGVITDDNSSIVVGHDGSRVLYDKEKPRTEIWIEPIIE